MWRSLVNNAQNYMDAHASDMNWIAGFQTEREYNQIIQAF